MPRYSSGAALLAGLALFAGSGRAADDDAKPLGSDGCDHTMTRAGYPESISRYARPSNTCEYYGYYVGGGCPCRGGPPGPLQGLWGWDYGGHPHLVKPRIVLNWCCRYQGGKGAYRTDGPHVPDVLAIKLPEGHSACEGKCEGH
jgi:hypothetical protein